MLPDEYQQRIATAEKALNYTFKDKGLILAAITHPSAVEGHATESSYERLEFLGDSIVGAIIAREAFNRFPDLDEGGLTRIKVALVAGSTLSDVAKNLGFDEVIIFGDSERGTGKRGMHSALENVYEATTAALYLDGGLSAAYTFVSETLFPRMTKDYAVRPENPKSALQEKLQEEGITPTYKLIETQGPPHDRTFITAVFAGVRSLARGVGRTKKESESRAADMALQIIESEEKARAKEAKKAARAQRKKEKRDAAASASEAEE